MRGVTREIHSSQNSWFKPSREGNQLRPGIGKVDLGGRFGSELLLSCAPSLDVRGRKEYDDWKPLARKTQRGGNIYNHSRQRKPGDLAEYLWKLRISGF